MTVIIVNSNCSLMYMYWMTLTLTLTLEMAIKNVEELMIMKLMIWLLIYVQGRLDYILDYFFLFITVLFNALLFYYY